MTHYFAVENSLFDRFRRGQNLEYDFPLGTIFCPSGSARKGCKRGREEGRFQLTILGLIENKYHFDHVLISLGISWGIGRNRILWLHRYYETFNLLQQKSNLPFLGFLIRDVKNHYFRHPVKKYVWKQDGDYWIFFSIYQTKSAHNLLMQNFKRKRYMFS